MPEILLESMQIGEIRGINWGNLQQSISIEGHTICPDYFLRALSEEINICLVTEKIDIWCH